MLTKAKITQIKSLSDKKERTSQRLFVAEGTKLVEDLLNSEMNVREVYALEGMCDSLPHFHNIMVVSPKEIDRISGLKTPAGVMALVETPNYELDVNILKNHLFLALDDIQDPGNLGTIIRLCDWFGIGDILCSQASADCFNPKVVQATMGAISRVRVHYVNLYETLCELKDIPIYGTFLSGDNIYKSELSQNGVVIMGNEGRGISDEIKSLVSNKLYIPSYSETSTSESLNVAIATAVICSEFRRR